jgi:hypothetical protein
MAGPAEGLLRNVVVGPGQQVVERLRAFGIGTFDFFLSPQPMRQVLAEELVRPGGGVAVGRDDQLALLL